MFTVSKITLVSTLAIATATVSATIGAGALLWKGASKLFAKAEAKVDDYRARQEAQAA